MRSSWDRDSNRMQNAECRTQNLEISSFYILHSAFCILVFGRFIETLRLRVAEREVASAISTGARPFARSRGWVRGGRVAEGSRSTCRKFSKSLKTKKGRYAPF